MTRTRLARLLSIENVWCLIALAGIFIFASTHPIRPHDFWWHIQAGRDIVATRQLPSIDTFSYTMYGQPYSNYGRFWLMECALYLLHALGGPALVIFTHSLLITAAYGLVLWLCWRIARDKRVAAAGCLFAAALGLNDWNVRPQTLAFLLAALCMWAMYAYASSGGRRWLAVPPACLALWVNSHPTFSIGLGLVGIWVMEAGWQAFQSRQVRRLLPPGLTLAAASLACLANPQGVGALAYLMAMGQNSIIQNMVAEWAPPSFGTLHGSLFLAGLLLSASLLALSPRRPSLSQLLTFLAFAGLSLKTSRGIVWFGIVMAPILASHLPGLGEQARQLFCPPAPAVPAGQAGRPAASLVLNGLLAGLALLGVLISLPWFKSWLHLPADKAGLLSAETPLAATRFLLQERPPGPLFHDQAYGSYLIWAAQPDYKVFVDPRLELYPAEIWMDYVYIATAQCGWEEKLAQYGINSLMLNVHEQPKLVRAASQSAGWRMIYQDEHSVLFERVPGEG